VARSLITSRWARRLAASLGAGGALALLVVLGFSEWGAKRAFERADEAWESGDYRRAVEGFAHVAQEYPRHALAPEALFRVGRINYLFLRDVGEAVHVLRDLAKDPAAGPWAVRAQRLLGEIFEQRQEDYRQAIVEYQRLITLNPGGEGNDEAQFAVARCYFKLEDFDQARAEYEVLLDRYPESGLRLAALLGIANAHYVAGRHAPAVKYYRQVMAEAKEKDAELAAEAGFGVASSLEETGDLAGALRELEKIRAYPNPALIAQRIARVRSRLAQVDSRSPAPPGRGEDRP
jgi:TolA-binding protein